MVIRYVCEKHSVVRVVILGRKTYATVLNLNAENASGIWVLKVILCWIKVVGNDAYAVCNSQAVAVLLFDPRLLCCMSVT